MDILHGALVRAQKEESRIVENTFCHLAEYIFYHDYVRSKNVKGTSTEVIDGNKEHDVEHWMEGDLCYKVTENLTELCFVGKKVKLASSELGYLTEISKQSIENAA